MPDATTEPVPFRLRLPDGTETEDLTDTETAHQIARHPSAVLITHTGDIDEARRAQRVLAEACSLRGHRLPMGLSEAEMLARAGSSGRVADALLRELDASRHRLDDARAESAHLRSLLDQQDGQIRTLICRRAAMLEACDTVDQLAPSERDQVLDTDDIRSLLATGALVDGAVPPGAGSVEQMVDTLRLIAGDRCETYTGGGWQCPDSGRQRISTTGTADQWCDACRAADALGLIPESAR